MKCLIKLKQSFIDKAIYKEPLLESFLTRPTIVLKALSIGHTRAALLFPGKYLSSLPSEQQQMFDRTIGDTEDLCMKVFDCPNNDPTKLYTVIGLTELY